MGAHFEALDEGVLLVPLDPRYTQVGFNPISVQVCNTVGRHLSFLEIEAMFQCHNIFHTRVVFNQKVEQCFVDFFLSIGH